MAEVSRARPSSAGLSRGCRWSLGPKNVIFPAPDDQKMSSSIFMVWNSLVTVPFELESDLHSSRSNDTFEHRIFRNSRSPPGEDAASQNAKTLAKSIISLYLLEWGGESLAVPRDENFLRGAGLHCRRLFSVTPSFRDSFRNGDPPFLHNFSQKVTGFCSKVLLECRFRCC